MDVESTNIFNKDRGEENLPDILESPFKQRSRVMSASSTTYYTSSFSTSSESDSQENSPTTKRNVKFPLDKHDPKNKFKSTSPTTHISSFNIKMGSSNGLVFQPEEHSWPRKTIDESRPRKTILPTKCELESDGRSSSSASTASSNESTTGLKQIGLFGIESFDVLDQLQANFPIFATFKLIWLGDSGVGKTSLINQFLNQHFRFDYKPTLGVDFATKTISGPEDSVIKLQLWDISGQDRFRFLSRAYYRGAHGCLLIFDRTNRISFHNVAAWKEELDSKVYSDRNDIKVPIFLLANKCDLDSAVTDLEINTLCEEKNFTGWASVSAVSGLNVEASLDSLTEMMIHQEQIRKQLPPGGPQINKEHKNSCKCS